MPTGATQQLTVNSRRRPGVAGMLVDLDRNNQEIDLLINSDPQGDELYTLVVDTATDAEVYGVDLTDPLTVDVNYTATAADKAVIALGMANAWNAAPQARAMAIALSDGVDTVTYTGTYPGVAFVMAEADNAGKMTLTNTTNAAEAATVPFGRAMVATSFQAGEPDQLGVLAKSSALAARVSTLTITYAAGERYAVGVTVNGQRYSVNVLADTDDDTTAAAINTAINAMLPADTVISTVATNVVTLTAELAGQYFDVDLGLVSGTTARMVLADTTNTPSCDFNQVFAGVSLWTYDEQQLAIASESAEYAKNAGVEVLRRGAVWVANTETLVAQSKVYVELDGTGSNAGKLYSTNSATRVLVDPAVARWQRSDGASSDADVAVLRLSLGA